jgi:ribose transport system permease protein
MSDAPPHARVEGSRMRALRARLGLSEILHTYALIPAWILVIAFFGFKEPSTFLTTSNFSTIFGSQAVLVVLTLGLLVPLTAGDYDLSIASIMTMATMEIAILNVNHHWPIVFAIGVAVATGLAAGFVNGAIVTLFEIDPFIVTLGTGTFISGLVYWISASQTIGGISSSLVSLVVLDRFLGVPLEFWYALILCVIMWYVFEYTPLGRRLLLVGRGRNVSRLSGLRVDRIRWGGMVTSGFMGALAGVLYAGTSGAADPYSGAGFLLPAYAAAFLGATSIVPGRFNPWGSFVAVYFLVTGITGLQLLGVESFVQQLFYGGALVLAVVFSQIARRRGGSASA